ncbi:MAG: FtsX-like permease family protein [Candidatus Thorarchaeota archaeon]|nr:FtsX-like permease family protein [Candidatus Thorarchaeota archaeon]
MVAALLSGSIRELMVFDLTQLQSYRIIASPTSLLGLIAYSFSVGLAIGIPTAIRAYLMKAADAHRAIAKDESVKDEKQSNAAVQIAGITISGVLLIPILGILSEASLGMLSSWLFSIILVVLLSIFLVSLSLLLARPTASIKSKVHLALSGTSFAVVSRILGKTAVTYKRSEMYSAMFIGLVFTAGILSALTATTGNAHMRGLYMYKVGGDVVLNVNPNLQNVTNDFVEEIRAIDGVSHATGILRTSGHVQFWVSWEGRMVYLNISMTIFGVQGEDWTSSAYFEPYFTFFNDPSISIPRIEENHSNVLASFLPIIGYDRDFLRQSYPIHSDQIRTRIRGADETHYLNATIVDVMADRTDGFTLGMHMWSQWMGNSYFPGESEDFAFVVMDLNYIQQCIDSTRLTRIYVSLEDKADYQRVIEDIAGIAPYSFEDIDSPYYYIDGILGSRAGQAIYGAYTLNILFSILFLSAGVTIVVTVKVRTISKHFSLLRALGVRPESITKSMIVDTVLGITLGLVMGSIAGFILTMILMQVPITYLGLSTDVAWEGLPLVLTIPGNLIGMILVLAFLFSLIGTYFVISRCLKTSIAETIQYSE